MKINIPNSAFLGNIDPFLRSFDNSAPGTLHITSNRKWISIHPLVLSMIAALSLNATNITYDKFEAASKHYLERMNLFRFLGIKSTGMRAHEPAGRFIPLMQIKNSDQLTAFLTDMVPLLHLEPKHAEPLRYVVSELVRNVLEHAQSPHGAIICAQYYKKSNSIRIGIADTGVGIRATISRAHPVNTDLEALRLALTPGITGTTPQEGGTELNAGAGLFFVKSIARVNPRFFFIYSGTASYKLLKSKTKHIMLHSDPLKDRNSYEENFPYWEGTLVGIDISLDATQEFSSLLDLIRKTYIQAMRDRKKQRRRRPKFV